VDKSGKGVCVQASTLGSMEALLGFLEKGGIPVCGINIGPVHKKDVMRAAAMLEHKAEYATILAFDVTIAKDIRELADKMKVRIFEAPIIYNLFDMFQKYLSGLRDARKAATAGQAVFPCMLEIMPDKVFRQRDPIVCGCRVVDGIAKIGTPIVAHKDGKVVELGRITSIESNHEEVKESKKGDEVAIKFTPDAGAAPVYYGRQFDYSWPLCSHLSRESIDVLKENFKDDMTEAQWRLIVKLKPIFNIP